MKNNLHKCKSIYCINVKVLFENVRVRVRVRPYPPFPTTLLLQVKPTTPKSPNETTPYCHMTHILGLQKPSHNICVD